MSQLGSPNHLAVVDDRLIEWIGTPHPQVALCLSRRLAIASELGQKDLVRYLHKVIRGHAAAKNRVKMVFDIARHEEAERVAQEMYAPRRGV